MNAIARPRRHSPLTAAARVALVALFVTGGAVLSGCASTSQIMSAVPAEPAPAESAGAATSRAESALITAIADRLVAGEEVAAYKAAHDLPISDPARESEVIDAAVASAAEQGVDEALVRQVVSDQIRASKIVQEGFQQLWRSGAATPSADPSLDHARSVISAATGTIVTELGASVVCPIEHATVAGISSRLQDLGLDGVSSDSAADAAVASLCPGGSGTH